MLKKAPLLRVLIPLVSGIITGIYFPVHHYFTLLIPAIFFLLNICFFALKNHATIFKTQPLQGIILNLFFITSAYSLTVNKTEYFHQQHYTKNTEIGVAYGEISEPLNFKGTSAKATINVLAIKSKDSWNSSTGKALVYFQQDSLVNTLKTGDRIVFEPNFKDIKGPQNPSEFNYKQYLSFHWIYKQAYLKSGKWQKINNGDNYSIKRYAEEWRNKLLSIIHSQNIYGNEAAVLSALIVGYKDKLESSIVRAYSASGAMHVLAVSGLHVGIIYILINYCLFFLNKIKYGIYFKTGIVLLILWIYALITGFSPSVLRASTMFTFVAVGNAFQRKTNIYNTLAASAILLLVLNPYMITEVGFQLSYFAVIGIVTFQKGIYNLLEINNKWIDKVWQLTTVSIAAQISTFPLGLLYFHQFPNYFLLSNLAVIPLATIIIHMGIAMFILSPINSIASYLGKATNFLIKTLNDSVMYFEKLPFAITDGIYITVIETIAIYLLIAFIYIYIIHKNKTFLFLFLITSIALFSYNIFEKIAQKKQRKFIVYNIQGTPAINFIDSNENLLFTNKKLSIDENKLTFHLKNNWIKDGLEKEKILSVNDLSKQTSVSLLYKINNTRLFIKRNFISFYNKKIVYIDDKSMLEYPVENKINCDYIILSNNVKVQLNDITKSFVFKEIIIDSSNSTYKTNNWLSEAEQLKIPIHAVANDGAYIVEI